MPNAVKAGGGLVILVLGETCQSQSLLGSERRIRLVLIHDVLRCGICESRYRPEQNLFAAPPGHFTFY